MIVEWAFAILDGIQTYSKENINVALFGYILKNEIDEGFKNIIDQIKETL